MNKQALESRDELSEPTYEMPVKATLPENFFASAVSRVVWDGEESCQKQMSQACTTTKGEQAETYRRYAGCSCDKAGTNCVGGKWKE